MIAVSNEGYPDDPALASQKICRIGDFWAADSIYDRNETDGYY
jgi:hypothetical protein